MQEATKIVDVDGTEINIEGDRSYGISYDEENDLKNRFTYHAPNSTQPARYERIRNKAKDLAKWMMSGCPRSRELSLALTKLEEAVMWANAAIARNE
jgi:hypothetical protein